MCAKSCSSRDAVVADSWVFLNGNFVVVTRRDIHCPHSVRLMEYPAFYSAWSCLTALSFKTVWRRISPIIPACFLNVMCS